MGTAASTNILGAGHVLVDDKTMEHAENNRPDEGESKNVAVERANDNSGSIPKQVDKNLIYDPKPVMYTDEEGEQLVEKCHQDTAVVMENFDENNNQQNVVVRNALLRLKKNYYLFKHAGVKRGLDYRRRVGVDLIKMGACEAMCRIIMRTLTTGWLTEERDIQVDVYNAFSNAFTVIFNFSDASPELGIEICRVQDFIGTLIVTLERFFKRSVEQEEVMHASEEAFVRSCLGLLHNCANVEENRAHLRQLGLSSVLFAYMNHSKVEKQRLCAVLGLADILTEEESKALQADTNGVKFMLRRLAMAVDDAQLRSMGWSAKELAGGVEKLACNDVNKKMLVDHGVLLTLTRMTHMDGLSEQCASVHALLALSFADDNKEKIIAEPGLVDRLQEMQKDCSDEGVQRAAKRTLWNLRDNLCLHDVYKQLGNSLRQVEKVKRADMGSHIMISYNWDHQETLLKVRDTLKQLKYKTWMDVDNMEGSTLEAMAEAVEKSAAVLICMSQQYKDSQFCRMEFEYAFKCKKLMVPLVMQPGYKADGWLGLVIGNMLYHDISGKYSFESRIEGMIKALGDRGKVVTNGNADAVDATVKENVIVPLRDMHLTGVPPGEGTKFHLPASTKLSAISNWSAYEMRAWLTDNALSKNPKLTKLTGKQLVFLWEVKSEAPEYFYRVLETQLKLQGIPDVMIFTAALKLLFR